MPVGTVVRVLVEKNFGFITPSDGDGRDVFFHANALDTSLDFDETLVERRVAFEMTTTDKGPRASSVRAAD